jgi:hypothetical protein
VVKLYFRILPETYADVLVVLVENSPIVYPQLAHERISFATKTSLSGR